MAVSPNPKYRNVRENYYTDKFPDTQTIGTIIQTLKSVEGSYDHSFVPTIVPSLGGGTTAYTEISGDAAPEDNPEFQYYGYIYCDGSEYYIHDYPALYEAIGNDYGGTASDGLDILTGGAGWGTTVTVSISAPPSGANQVFEGITPVQATATATVVNGVITGAEVTNPGRGYDPENPPTVTFTSSNSGTAPTYALRLNSSNGQIQSINKNNVFQYWPDTNMGTFQVPDLKAKRIVGNGPVYGTNTPNVGNSELGVGINTIDGNWYMDKNTQKNQFSLGNISTTGYSNVVDNVEASIIGSQVVSVTLQEKKISGAPQHSHFLLHSEAPQDTPSPQAVSGDRYVVSYRQSTGRVNSFLPPGGIAYNHTHVLSKAPILDASVGTYDIFNWSGGDQNSGSIKSEGYYYASGGAGAGSYVEQTDYGTPEMQVFTTVSLIGGRQIVTDGVPIYETDENEYTSAGNYTLSVPSGVDQATITLVGAGGSGGVYSNAGNDGQGSTLSVGSGGSVLLITAEGGDGGGAASNSSGGDGGSAGGQSVTGSASGDVVITINGAGSGGNGGDGGDGRYWNKDLEDTSVVPSGANGSAGTNLTGANGTVGKSRPVTNINTEEYNFNYSGGTDQTWTLTASNSNYGIIGLQWELAGGGGRDCGNFGGNGCGTAGEGGAGKYMKIQYGNPSSNITFKVQPGQSGRAYNSSASAAHSGTGGRAGDGYGSNDGGGGGAATVLRLQSGNLIIAGAGGGGGGGGFGEGSCGQNGRNNNEPGDSVIETTQALFTGGGGTGGGYGCTGGGGGGGGGGCGRAGDGGGGSAGTGGGAQGSGGHEEGYGGRRGCSAVRTDYFSSVTSQGNTNNGNGYAKATVTEDGGYWTSGAGGGGSGGIIQATAPAEAFTGQSSISITVGEGGSGVSQSGTSSSAGSDGYANVTWQTVIGYQGGTESISVGDVFIAGSGDQDNGVNFFSSGTGTNASNGFAFPTTQVPTVVFEGGGGGSGAAATCTVSNNIVSGISLTNSGSGYTQAPRVRLLHGAGVQNYATVGFDETTGELEGLTLQSSSAPTTYLKFGGTQQSRFVAMDTVDATEIKRITVKVARGNGKNGGDRPENGGDELLLYYNTDESLNFPSSGFIGTLVPIPTAANISSDYDGTGTGGNPTNWYTYSLDLPEAAKTENTRFSIRQNRSQGTDSNSNTDHYGILEVTYENDLTTDLVFVPSEGQMAIINDTQTYSVEGAAGSTYTSGIFANDLTLTLSSANPIIPVAALDPDINVPLIEPYFLVKYLIKAF